MYIYKVNNHYKDLIKNCIEKLAAINIPISQSISFKENTGFSRYGFCKRTRNKDTDFTIAINKWFEKDEDIITTIMHELLHTIDGCYNHGKIFHNYANLIYKAYGVKVTVYGNHQLNEKAYKNKGIRRNVFKAEDFDNKTMYLMYCPKCKNTFAIKKSSFKFGSRWMCKKCHQKLLYV